MSLSVVEVKDQTDVTAKIIIESDHVDGSIAYTELASADCRKLAIKTAAEKGLSSPGINGNVVSYPIDKSGKEVVDAINQKVHRFRAEVPVTRRIV